MPRKRQHREQWEITRKTVYSRDQGHCVNCETAVSLYECHIDHIVSGKLGSNHISNLRVLCKRCHGLRSDHRHAGMRGRMIAEGLIPPNWRHLVIDI